MRPVFDRDVGLSEKAVIGLYGEPDAIHSFTAGEAADELRARLPHVVLKQTPGARVNEMYYKKPRVEQIFWLTKKGEDGWTVVSSVEIPDGVLF